LIARRAPAADPGGVDQDHGQPVEAEDGVDRVARGPRDLADERSLVAEEGIEQGGLPDVGTSHDGDPCHAILALGGLGRRRGQDLERSVEQVVDADAVLGGDHQDLLEAKLEYLVPEMLLARDVGLVRRDDHRSPRPAEQLGDVTVDRRQTLPDVEQEDDGICFLDGDPGLCLDVGLAEFPVRRSAVELQPGGVDHRELASQPLADAVEAVTRQAGGRVHDRLSPADQSVEERGLADVGPADDGDDGAGHAHIVPGLPCKTCSVAIRLTRCSRTG
jgi:hypothetical protein